MKTRYKPLQIALLIFAVLIFSIPIYKSFSDYETVWKFPTLGIGVMIFLLFLYVWFFWNAPLIIFTGDGIIRSRFFIKKRYDWHEVSEVLLSNKEVFLILIFGQPYEATSIKFDNGDKIILWNDIYSNLNEIRELIADKAKDKIKDELPKINSSSVRSIGTKIYKGNPFISFNTILIFGITVWFLFLIFKDVIQKPGVLFVLLFPLVMFVGFGFQMNYFILDNDCLIIKNHYFPWKNIVYPLDDIIELDIETPYRRSTALRILTKEYKSKLYGAGSLRQHNWDELKSDIIKIGISLRTD